jgi:hypothetical protein
VRLDFATPDATTFYLSASDFFLNSLPENGFTIKTLRGKKSFLYYRGKEKKRWLLRNPTKYRPLGKPWGIKLSLSMLLLSRLCAGEEKRVTYG